MKESSGPTTGAIRKDVKDKDKYLLMVFWSPSFATCSLALFLSVRIPALAGGFVSSFGKGGSLFRRKLADRCVEEGGDIRVPGASRGRLEVGVEEVSCLSEEFPVALA
jgi:hypothetical protein